MFHVFHNVPRKMSLVEHWEGAWLLDKWEMFHVFQYFLVNKISITTNNGRRSVLPKFCFWWNIGTFVPIPSVNVRCYNEICVPRKCSTRWLDRGTCGTYFSQCEQPLNVVHTCDDSSPSIHSRQAGECKTAPLSAFVLECVATRPIVVATGALGIRNWLSLIDKCQAHPSHRC